jgi:hypothetical protein
MLRVANKVKEMRIGRAAMDDFVKNSAEGKSLPPSETKQCGVFSG